MKQYINSSILLLRCIIAFYYKIRSRIIPINSQKTLNKSSNIIVSFTSYGRRVKSCAYYTAYSLLNQTHRPKTVVLWLDNANWHENNIPEDLKKLLSNGLDIRFCDDLKSYKKLLPSLKAFPDDVIITVDDDIYYEKRLVEKLYKTYCMNNRIVASVAHVPLLNDDGALVSYNSWFDACAKYKDDFKDIFPVGAGGILYPPNSFVDEVFNIARISLLCPKADDVWFYFMALLNHQSHVLSEPVKLYPTDYFYQKLNRNSSLMDSNVSCNQNDIQISKIIDYYKIDIVKYLNYK